MGRRRTGADRWRGKKSPHPGTEVRRQQKQGECMDPVERILLMAQQ
jgi:hypothetical protein